MFKLLPINSPKLTVGLKYVLNCNANAKEIEMAKEALPNAWTVTSNPP
jgi:hypothetical protein